MDPEEGVYEYAGKEREQDGVEQEKDPVEVAASAGEPHRLEGIEEIHQSAEHNQHGLHRD